MAIGAEDPTVWESLKSGLEPRESLGEKVRHLFGRDTGITRGNLMSRMEEALGSLAPDRRTQIMSKVPPFLSLFPNSPITPIISR